MKKIKKNNLQIKKKLTFYPILIVIISIAGIPPLLGFIPKWIILESISKININIRIIFIILIMAGINFFIYTRLTFSPTIFKSITIKKNLNLIKLNLKKILLVTQLILPVRAIIIIK